MKQTAPSDCAAASVDSTENAKKPSETYTTGDMARLSNNTLRTVRFYEEAGILTPIGRTDGGHRVFERTQLDRLLLVTDMREAGFSLEQIRELLETKQRAASGGAAAQAAVASLKAHIQDLRVKVEVLTRLAADLEHTATVASACLECKDVELFPHRCSSCDRMPGQGELPRGMRVLWSIAAGGGSSASALGAGNGASASAHASTSNGTTSSHANGDASKRPAGALVNKKVRA
jgi:DNA-binding transcriptional MerR regulator